MIQANVENYQKYLKITEEIDRLIASVKYDTEFYSNHIHKQKHPDYIKLVEMGDKIITYLIKQANHYGWSWLTIDLLYDITKENVIAKENAGKFSLIVADWLNWFNNSKYSKTDVYYGLID